jgi:hypothetical protein
VEAKLAAAIAAERSANDNGKASVANRNAATRGVWIATIEAAAAVPAFNAEAWFAAYYAGIDAPKGQTKSSRLTEARSVIEAARKDVATVTALWPVKPEGDNDVPRVNRAWFFRAVNAFRSGNNAPPAAILEATKKAPVAEANDGDVLVEMIGLASILYTKHPSTFAKLQGPLITLQQEYNAARLRGEFRTSDELAKQPASNVAMFQPIAA